MKKLRKAERPLIYHNAVEQPYAGNALVRLHDTDDRRLIGHSIPADVKDTEQYLKMMSAFLDQLEAESHSELAGEKTNLKVIPPGGIIKGNPEKTKGNLAVQSSDDIANFKIIPKQHKVYKNRSGKQIFEKESFECQVVFQNGATELMEVKTSEVSSIARKVRERYAYAQIDYTQPALAEKTIESEFRSMVKSVPAVCILVDAGWQKLGNRWVYVHDSAALPDGYKACTGLNLPNAYLSSLDARTIFQKAINLMADEAISLVLIIYSFMGIFYRVLKEAGISRPGFTLFINGRTGSMKTTISIILFSQLCQDQLRTTPRRIDMDTETSFEMALCQTGYDTITLFDDYAPSKTRTKKAQMIDKLETIIRLVGDGGGKNRSNSNLEDVRSNGVQGLAVVTGELRGKGESTNLRILYVFFPLHGANKEIVSWFQSNMQAYPALLNRFADFVGSYWDGLVGFAKQEIPLLRDELSRHLAENRLIDTAVLLSITGRVICRFLEECCEYAPQETEVLLQNMMRAIIDTVIKSAGASKKESFSLVFLKAFLELLQMDKIRIHEGKLEDAAMLGKFAGYSDKDFYYLYLPQCYEIVSTYINSRSSYFSLSQDEIADELFRDGLVVPSRNGKTADGNCRVNKYWRVQIEGVRGKVNFVKIRKADFERATNCEDLQEFEEIFGGDR